MSVRASAEKVPVPIHRGTPSMADALAQIWLWIADEFEDRPVVAIGVLVAFALAIAGAVIVFGI
jgi:hypothetical protein